MVGRLIDIQDGTSPQSMSKHKKSRSIGTFNSRTSEHMKWKLVIHNSKAQHKHQQNLKLRLENEKLVDRIYSQKSSVDHKLHLKDFERNRQVYQKLRKNPNSYFLPPIKKIHGQSSRARKKSDFKQYKNSQALLNKQLKRRLKVSQDPDS